MTLIKDVSDTAFWVATYRAEETERPDALFRDPFASRLVGEKGRTISIKMFGSRYTRWSVVIRTVIIDRYIERLVREGVDTVINLGAGLDTRPYRMDLPASLRWIEVDFPPMIDFKNRELGGETPKVRLERIALDLSNRKERAALFSTLAASTRNAVVITEGVIPYLSNQAVEELAEDLRAQPSFRHWIAEYFSPELLKYFRNPKRMAAMKNAPFLFDPTNWSELFGSRGWNSREIQYIGIESRKVGRRMPIPWWVVPMMMLMPRKKREAMAKFSGYAILDAK